MGFTNVSLRTKFFVIFVLLISGLAACMDSTNNKEFKPIPRLVNILITPQYYNNEYVNIAGYLSKYMKLHISKELAMFDTSSDGIQVQDVTNDALLGNSNCLDRYVKLSGKLKKGKNSYDTYFITNISQVSTFNDKGELFSCYMDEKTQKKHNEFQNTLIPI